MLFFEILIIPSCSFKKTDLNPHDLSFVNRTLKDSQSNNVKTLKGLGDINLNANGSKSSFRLAFALEKPCKIRMVAMAAGQPIETVSTDCYYMYLLSHNNKHGFYKKRLTGYILESIIKIPVTSEDIILFLSGNIPLKGYDYIELEKKQDRSKVISLNKNWSGIQQKIHIKNNLIEKVSIFSSRKIQYSVQIKYKRIQGYKLPNKLIFTKDNKNSFELDIRRVWPNSSVKSSMFVLTPKD